MALFRAILTTLVLTLTTTSFAQTFASSAGPLHAEVITNDLRNPWAIAFLPDGRLLVTERAGQLRIVTLEGDIGAPISGLPKVSAKGQGGLLDVALAPDFATSGQLYLTFSERAVDAGTNRGTGTALLSATLTLSGDSGAVSNQVTIFRMNIFTGTNRHYGSRIVIAPDGNLWVTLGERGDGERAQDPFDLAGAVVRIKPNGSIPADNPFANGKDGHPAIWSIGHRNPQGATLGPDGKLWTLEHGAQGGDEINKPEPGKNYGWPVITYGKNYNGAKIGVGTHADGYEQPIYYWDPSIAPSGLDFYDGDLFPTWQGSLLAGALKFQLLSRLEMDGDKVVGEEQLFKGAFGRIRDVRTGPDGAIYLATDDRNGKIVRITPAE